MTEDRIRKLLAKGEGLTVEYKKCADGLSNSVYETVCAFSNRYEVIQSCVPGYATDTILRKYNMDRYDDRLLVETNLIESYDLIMDFIAKHTLDKFFLIDNQRVSVRTWIAREIVSNILVHREYSSPFPAKIIVEKHRLYAEKSEYGSYAWAH